MANKKILTVEEQKHLLSTLPEIFQSLTKAEIRDIIVKLGLQDLLDENGNLVTVYTLDIYSNKPTYITSDYNIKIRGNAYSRGIPANDEVTSWRWERISGVPAEDAAWAQGKNNQEISLSESDFTSRLNTRDIIFKVYATIKNTEYSDEITYSKSQIFNKIQIKTSHDLFLEDSPLNIRVDTIEEGQFSDYRWYLDNNVVSSQRSFNLSVNSIPLRGSAILKVEAKDPTGKTHSDTKTIPRISNGTDGEPGVPGAPGSNSYTWIKYSNSPTGQNMSEYPIDERTGIPLEYIGMSPNQSSPNESNNPEDYTWTKYIGTDGIPGESVLTSIVFKRSADAPAAPTGGTYLNPIPSGWSDGIPDIEGDFPVWMSSRIFTLSGNHPQEPTWSKPQVTSDTATLDFDWSSSDVENPGTPDAPLNGAVWEELSSTESIWMAIQRTVNGEKKPWEVKKIKGEKGQTGQSVLTSFIFKRLATIPTTPSGGNFSNPVPPGWYDGIPTQLDGMPLWMSSRVMTSDGLSPQQATWSIPVLAADTADIDFEWTDSTANNPGTPSTPLNGAVWTNENSINSVWMAFRKIENGLPREWSVSKIKGEEGNSSFNANIFIRSKSQPNAPIGGSFSSYVPAGWSDGIPAANGDPVWMSTRIFSSDGLVPQQATWSTPSLVVDTSSVDYEFSNFTGGNPGNPSTPLNGAVWTNEGSVDTVWMAVAEISNGVRGEWSVTKIKGEEGESSYMWIKYSEYPLGRDTNGTVSMFDAPFIIKPNGEREDMVYMGIAYNKQTKQEADPNTPEGAPEQYVWSKIKGENGHSNYILELSNDNTSVSALADGTIPNPGVAFSTATTDISLTYGNDLVERGEYTLQFIASSGVSYTTSDEGHTLSLTGLTVDVGQIKVKALSTEANPKVITTATFSIVKIKGSAIYEIFPSVNAIKIINTPGQAPTVSPTAIEVNVKMNTGESVSYTTQGRLTYKYIYANTNSTSTDDGTPITIGELMQIDNSGNPIFIEFKYFHPVTNVLVDIERVSFNRDGVSGTSVEQRYKTNTNSVSPPAVDIAETNPTGWSTDIPALTTGEILWMIKATKRGDTGALIGTWSIPVKVSGGTGPQGPPGINGTSGPTPRLLEFVQGASYENGGLYIDYAYYRSNDVNEGWYTVKLPSGHTSGTVVKQTYAGGIPDNTKFDKAPFTKEMSFGTVIAEQANLAGFIFRNQVLYSQTGSNNSSCHPESNKFNSNLSLDGFNGVIRFLDRMVLDSSGITLKDNCGKPRMQFQWTLEGTPRLRFLNENGETTWEAGNNGYIAYFQSRPTTYTEITGEFISGVSVGTTPTATQIKNGVNHNIIGNILCKCGSDYIEFSTYAGSNPPTIGYFLSAGTPDVATQNEINNNGKIFKDRNIPSGFADTGWYLINIQAYYGSSPNTQAVVSLLKVNNGLGQNIDIIIDDFRELGTIYPCGIHGTPQC